MPGPYPPTHRTISAARRSAKTVPAQRVGLPGPIGAAIHYDADGRAWLTPLFFTNYIKLMPTSYTDLYFRSLCRPCGNGSGAGVADASYALGRCSQQFKDMPNESGIRRRATRHRFKRQFYLVAMRSFYSISSNLPVSPGSGLSRVEDVPRSSRCSSSYSDSFRVFLHLEKGCAGWAERDRSNGSCNISKCYPTFARASRGRGRGRLTPAR